MEINEQPPIVLDLCGGSGSWSRPYKEAGYDVRVITLPDYDVRTYAPPIQYMEFSPPLRVQSFLYSTARRKQDKEIQRPEWKL